MTKIIIHIEGGCVQAVYSDNPDVEVVLMDWDDADCDSKAKARCELLQEECEVMEMVF
jgi:hypothetical protein